MHNLIEEFISSLSNDRVITGAGLAERYNHIWTMDHALSAICVLLPRSTEEVSKILVICNKHHQPVVIHGGLTNLVGGTETQANEVVISLEKMNEIEEVDTQSRTITVQAGTILENVQRAAAEKGLLFPLNFGAKGSAQMGGIIATNAGGLRVLRYGMTRQLVVGLETVLADGTVISSMKKLIKDNSAYDLKQLFIGSEGTLGITTRAILRLVEAPETRISSIVGLEKYDDVVSFLKFMDKGLAGTLSSFELMWRPTYKVLTSPPALATPPLPYDHNYYVLLDSLGANSKLDTTRFHRLLEEALADGMIQDAAPAESESEIARFWSIRENVDPMVIQCNHNQQFDISLPIPLIGKVVNHMVDALYQIPGVEKVFTFGHVADGNIHLVVGKKDQSEDLINQINETVYQPLQSIGGSISAEHGIGVHKKNYLHLSRTAQEISLMKMLKKTLDPSNILNPGKILDFT